MKKFLITLVALTMTSGAYASKARLLALGDDKDGSFFINDFRNIFLNSANIHNHADTAFFELGDSGNSLSLDMDNDQKAMGGFLKSSGNFVYGLYLGNESDTDNLLRSTAWGSTTATQSLSPVDNVTDFFFGGTAGGVKWGANFVYSKNEDEANKKEDDRMAVRLGMLMGDLEAFANISLANESTDTDAGSTAGTIRKFDGSHGYHVGGSYQIGNFTPYVSYKDGSWDNIDGTTTVEGTFTEIKAGVGHTHEVSSTSRIYTRLNYFSEEVELKYASNPAKAELMRIPLTVAYEGDATSWLTLRGSVSTNLRGSRDTQNLSSVPNATIQNVLNGRYNGGLSGDRDETIQNATVVSAGATLNFGKLKIDGLIGNSGNDGDASGSTGNKVGVLALDRLMTRVAMTYSF